MEWTPDFRLGGEPIHEALGEGPVEYILGEDGGR